MINLKKQDPVADSIKSILEKKELSPKQKQIAKMSPPKDKIDAGDLAKLRAGHKPVKSEGMDEEIDPKKTTTDTLRGREKKSDNPFLSKKVFMDVPGDVKEEAEQIDELKKSTVKSYIGKKMDKIYSSPAPDKEKVKKDLKSLQRGHERVVGNKPTSEGLTLKKFKELNENHSIFDQMINEVLGKDASAGDWIHDFVHSDNPKFKGKSKEMRKKMALAAYYAKQRNEEVEQIEEGKMKELTMDLKDMSHDEFQKEYGKPKSHFTDKSSASGGDVKAKIASTKEKLSSLKKEETEQVEEGWDDMLKATKERSGPQPSGGSGVKAGSRYGGSKQKDKPEQDQEEPKKKVNEAKRPESDTVPFVTNEPPPFEGPYKKPTGVVVDKSGAKHTPMSRVKHLAKQAMKRVKNEMLGKTGTSE